MRSRLALLIFLASLSACEDGPEQLFSPNLGNPPVQNGYAPSPPWTQTGTKTFGDLSKGDSAGRARACDEAEQTALIQTMVQAPVIPDFSVGGIPMRNADGTPLHADDLIGRPEDGKFCDPSFIYLDAFTWGPTDEVIVFFNVDTRLVEGLVAYQQYLGALEGSFTRDGVQVPVVIRPRSRLAIGGVELDQFSSRADQESRPGSWLNHKNVTAIYRMIRQTYFGAPAFAEDFDCVASKRCDLIYTTGDESTPQETVIVIQDSGIQIDISPEGHANYVYLTPVRVAPFEVSGEIRFGQQTGTEMSFGFTSDLLPSCTVSPGAQTWGDFKSRCIEAGDTRTLSRVDYQVETQRDAVQVVFNGMDLGFLRKTSQSAVFKDGEPPADGDTLYAVTFTRSLEAPVQEFSARVLGNLYRQKLQQRLRNAIIASGGSIPPEDHPFYAYTFPVPFLLDESQRIGELLVGDTSWIPQVVDGVRTAYSAMSEAEREMLDPGVIDEIFLLEPFVDAVLNAFSHGKSEAADTSKVFRSTDDRRWSIGLAHFFQNGVPHRLQVQYSLNFGAITAVIVEQGFSEVDEIFDALNDQMGGGQPYLRGELLRGNHAYAPGGLGIVVKGFDRRLGTVDVELRKLLAGGTFAPINLTVPGEPIEDKNGFLRQVRGQRYEFVPSTTVQLYGKESLLNFHVEADGTIGRVANVQFKGSVELCPGIPIAYGDDVRAKIDSFIRANGEDTYRDCEVVFNYSENGNVLDGVASLFNRVELVVVDGRAVNAIVWR